MGLKGGISIDADRLGRSQDFFTFIQIGSGHAAGPCLILFFCSYHNIKRTNYGDPQERVFKLVHLINTITRSWDCGWCRLEVLHHRRYKPLCNACRYIQFRLPTHFDFRIGNCLSYILPSYVADSQALCLTTWIKIPVCKCCTGKQFFLNRNTIIYRNLRFLGYVAEPTKSLNRLKQVLLSTGFTELSQSQFTQLCRFFQYHSVCKLLPQKRILL